MSTITVDPNDKNKLIIKEGKRCTIPKRYNSFWDHDYLNNTGSLPEEWPAITRNHRISDRNIQLIIVNSVNEDDTTQLDNLIEHAFPWGNDEDQETATNLRNALHNENISIYKKALIASQLASFMAGYWNNISKGNALQNSAIGKYLDLNAPKNEDGQHSFSPRSRRIARAAYYFDAGLLAARCENGKIMSSQYGVGGSDNKSAKNIDPNLSTPETQRFSIALMP